MSLSLATAAEQGKYVIPCCDGRLLLEGSDIAADVYAPKFQWFGDWIFMCAGNLASTDLVIEEIRIASLDKRSAELFTRDKIADTLVWAFNRRLERWSAIRHLSAFGMTMQEFKRGRAQLGNTMHAELLREMHNDAQKYFRDEVMVVGWGLSPHALTIHSVNIAGDRSHSKDGHGAIGSGALAATTTLLQFQHGRHVSLQDAIYMTAVAKFSAESKKVGPDTTMAITRRRQQSENRVTAIPVQPDTMNDLRAIWKKNKRRFTVPLTAREALTTVIELTNDEEVINRCAHEKTIAALTAAMKKAKRAEGRP